MAEFSKCPYCEGTDGGEVWCCTNDGTEFCKRCGVKGHAGFSHCPTCYNGLRGARERYVGDIRPARAAEMQPAIDQDLI
jgi:hypothetical protein